MAESITVRLLGPIEVAGPQGVAILVGARQRSLVALLALQAGKAVPADRIIDGLWGDDAPRTAVRTLQSHLARIRQALSAAGLPNAIASGPAGHVLHLPVESIDMHVFEDRVRRGRARLGSGAPREAESFLRDALGLWRGDALQDGEAHGHAIAELNRLHDMRSSALEDLCDAWIRLGDHAEAIGDLQQLHAAQPYRERAAGLLMLGLYRSGRAADALNVFQRMRTDLAEGLGVDPGAELQQLYSAILRQDPALEVTPDRVVIDRVAGPAELPTRVGYFTGRNDEFKGLDKMLAARATDANNKIVLVSGAAGMGKSALALEWAHHVAGRFPDGQLFLDLQGHDPHATLSPAAVVSHLLRGLGVPRDRVPSELTEQTSLYRSLVHHRRYLILLDNARTVEQVLPAVPATETSLLIVTSRQELAALAVRQPVHFVQMDPLDGEAGLDLLRRAVDAERIEAEREAADSLVGVCGGMPLAIRITAARLASRPGLAVADLVADVHRRELDALAVPGDAAGIRAVFASAYLSLSEPVRRTFRLLSLHAGPSFSAHLAAVITGGSYAEAAAHLAELAGTNLLMPGGERYRFHDLIQLYAAECTKVEEPGSAIASTRSRIFDWYLGIAHAANQVLDPARDKVNITTELAELPFERTHPQVMSFLDGEQPSLGPVVRNAVQTGNHVTAWQLTYLVSGFYDSHGVHDRLEMCANGIRAAQELADPAAEVLMRNIYAATCVLMRRFDEALAQLDAALPLAHEAADTWYLATTHTNIAVANSWLKRYDLAQQAYERSLAIHTANGNTHSMALLLNNLGNLRRKAGEGLEALEYLAQALELASSLDSPRLEAIIHQTTGEAHKALGAHQAALDQLRQALALRRRIADRRGEVEALHEMGAIHFDLEDTSSALTAFQEALGLCKLLGNEHLTAVLLRRAGETMLRAGDLPAATSLLQESRNLRARIPDPDEETRLRQNIDELQNLSSVYPP